MPLLDRLGMLGSFKIVVVLQALWCPKRHVQLCQTANIAAIQLQGQRTGGGAQDHLGHKFLLQFSHRPSCSLGFNRSGPAMPARPLG